MKKLIGAIGIGVLLCTGCGRPSSESSAPPKKANQQITVKGSDTMVHLVTSWAEAFGKAQPGIEVSVTGGGSGTGIAALLNRTTDICAASREMSADEKAQAAQKGLKPQEIVVARDGIAVIVHSSNPINELTLEQLKKIFTGAWTDWSQVGGGSRGDIIVLSRESSSGTYVFFQEHVMKKQDYTPRARLMPATSAIIQSVGEDANAIGYVGLGYAVEAGPKVKMLRIKGDANAPGVPPSEAAVKDGSYSVARALYFYVSDAPAGALAQFTQFCQGVDGQRIVRETGYVPVQ